MCIRDRPKELDGKAITGGSWAAVDVSTLADDAAIRAAAQQLKAQGADYGLVTLNTPDGSICYASQVPAAAQSIADTTVDPVSYTHLLHHLKVGQDQLVVDGIDVGNGVHGLSLGNILHHMDDVVIVKACRLYTSRCV